MDDFRKFGWFDFNNQTNTILLWQGVLAVYTTSDKKTPTKTLMRLVKMSKCGISELNLTVHHNSTTTSITVSSEGYSTCAEIEAVIFDEKKRTIW